MLPEQLLRTGAKGHSKKPLLTFTRDKEVPGASGKGQRPVQEFNRQAQSSAGGELRYYDYLAQQDGKQGKYLETGGPSNRLQEG